MAPSSGNFGLGEASRFGSQLGDIAPPARGRDIQRMPVMEVVFLALAMAMDAFAVCLAAGSVGQVRGPRPAFRLSFHFGLFQFMMPVLGWMAGAGVEPLIRHYDHWLAFGLLAFVGARMIYSAWHPEDTRASDPSRGWMLILLSIAVSIDAFAVGLSLGLLSISVWYPALVIGVVTAALSLAGLRIGTSFGMRFGPAVQILGGVILIGIGVRLVAAALASA